MTRHPDDDHASSPTALAFTEDDEASFEDLVEDLVSFSTAPPPGDIHNACTTVTALPYSLLESLKGAPRPEGEASAPPVERTVEIAPPAPDNDDLLLSALETMYEEDGPIEHATVIVEAEPPEGASGSDLESAFAAALADAALADATLSASTHAEPTDAESRRSPTARPHASELALPATAPPLRWTIHLPRPMLLAGFLFAAVAAASVSAVVMWTFVRVFYH